MWGTSADTAEFALQSIRQCWQNMGKPRYRKARCLLICADSGDSNGYRLHLWKRNLQNSATAEKLTITGCHFPPRAIVNLIARTTAKKGLTVKSRLDRGTYARAIKLSKREMQSFNIKPYVFHGEWNYTIAPKKSSA